MVFSIKSSALVATSAVAMAVSVGFTMARLAPARSWWWLAILVANAGARPRALSFRGESVAFAVTVAARSAAVATAVVSRFAVTETILAATAVRVVAAQQGEEGGLRLHLR